MGLRFLSDKGSSLWCSPVLDIGKLMLSGKDVNMLLSTYACLWAGLCALPHSIYGIA